MSHVTHVSCPVLSSIHRKSAECRGCGIGRGVDLRWHELEVVPDAVRDGHAHHAADRALDSGILGRLAVREHLRCAMSAGRELVWRQAPVCGARTEVEAGGGEPFCSLRTPSNMDARCRLSSSMMPSAENRGCLRIASSTAAALLGGSSGAPCRRAPTWRCRRAPSTLSMTCALRRARSSGPAISPVGLWQRSESA